MLYRLYKPEDFDALYAIEEVCFPWPDRFSRAYMRQVIRKRTAATWIAEDGERLCGFAVVEWTHESSRLLAYIQTLEVLPEWRGQGVGEELMRRIESSACAAGSQGIWLHVDPSNTDAVRLYERLEYVFSGRREDYYGLGRPALLYAKPLDAVVAGRVG